MGGQKQRILEDLEMAGVTRIQREHGALEKEDVRAWVLSLRILLPPAFTRLRV